MMRTLSRREVLEIGLGSMGGLALAIRGALMAPLIADAGTLSSAPKTAPSSVFGGLRIGCMTWSFRDHPLEAALHKISDIGFSSVELWNGHLDPFKASDRELADWRRKFSEAGVRITSYFVDLPDKASDDQIIRCFHAGRLLGADTLSGNLSKPLVARVDKACQNFKMYVGLHNEVYRPSKPDEVEFPADYEEVFRKTSNWVGATLDVGHLYAAGSDPVLFIRKHLHRIVSLHLKDEGRDSQVTDFAFGKGPTPLIPILHTLQKLHYRRASNIEWGVNADPVRGVADALAYVKHALS